LILTDVIDVPAAVETVRDYILGDSTLRELMQPMLAGGDPDTDTVKRMARILARVLGRGPRYQCGNCGFAAKSWFWQCPGCKEWDSMRPQYSSHVPLQAPTGM